MSDNTESTIKKITFEGQTYKVPVWVGWVARDADGTVWGYVNEPEQGVNFWCDTLWCDTKRKDKQEFLGVRCNWENSSMAVL